MLGWSALIEISGVTRTVYKRKLLLSPGRLPLANVLSRLLLLSFSDDPTITAEKFECGLIALSLNSLLQK